LFHDQIPSTEQRMKEALTIKTPWINPAVVNTFVNNMVRDLHLLHQLIVDFKQTSTAIEDICKKISRVNIVQAQIRKRIYIVSEFKDIQSKQRHSARDQVEESYNRANVTLAEMFRQFSVKSREVKVH